VILAYSTCTATGMVLTTAIIAPVARCVAFDTRFDTTTLCMADASCYPAVSAVLLFSVEAFVGR